MEFTNNNLTFVIVTFKSDKIIEECIKSLPKEFPKIIVENSNDKQLKDKLEQNYDNLKVLISNNIGMGSGNNLGITESKTEFVYIINPDVCFFSDTMQNLNSSIRSVTDFGIMSPISSNKDYPNFKQKKHDTCLNENLLLVDEIDGYSMILNKKKFNNSYFFDENFFMYLENVDLCRRAKKCKEKILIVKNSQIEHLGAKSVDGTFSQQIEYSRNWHWMWSKFYFKKKYNGFILAFFEYLPIILILHLKYLYHKITFNHSRSKILKLRISGLFNSILGNKSYFRPKID